MNHKNTKEPSSLLSKLISRIPLYVMLAALMFWGIAYWNAASYPAEPPMQDKTRLYKQSFSFTSAFPFYYKYYLLIPENYNANQRYPLALLLHGQSRHMYGGKTILTSGAQFMHQAFVVIPIAPAEMTWASFDGRQRSALPLAMDAVKEVQKKYSIDPKRMYVSGYSMGGTGTFGMIERYPDVFAAAMPLCGYWPPERANLFPDNVPVFAIHGQNDGPEGSRNMVNALKAQGKTAFFSEYPNVGHNVWDYVYTDPKIWDWLFSQNKK